MAKPRRDPPPRRNPDRSPGPDYSLQPPSADSPKSRAAPDKHSPRDPDDFDPTPYFRDRPDPPLDSARPRSADSYTVDSSGADSLPRYSVPAYLDEPESVPNRPQLASPTHALPPPPPPLLEPEAQQFSLAGLIVLVAACALMFAVGRLLPPRLFAALAGLATIFGLILLPRLNPSSGLLRLARWLLVAAYFTAAALALTFTET